MSSPSRVKGFGFERTVVKEFVEAGLKARRAFGSNGQALGQHEEVDVLVTMLPEDLKIQCKRKKKLPDYLGLTEHVDAAVFKEDRGNTYIMMPLDLFIKRFLV